MLSRDRHSTYPGIFLSSMAATSRRRARTGAVQPAERQGKVARTGISLDEWVAQDKPKWLSEEALRIARLNLRDRSQIVHPPHEELYLDTMFAAVPSAVIAPPKSL